MANKNKQYLTKAAQVEYKKFRVTLKDEKEVYTKSAYAQIYKGYDFLENLFVIRQYICSRYDIPWRTLELLLKLMGLRVFTLKDYTSLPKHYTASRFNNMRDRGYIVLLSEHNEILNCVFCLSPMAQNVVIMFYKMLAGEIPIPETEKKNPFIGSDVAIDKKRLSLIKKLNKLPTKNHNKRLF